MHELPDPDETGYEHQNGSHAHRGQSVRATDACAPMFGGKIDLPGAQIADGVVEGSGCPILADWRAGVARGGSVTLDRPHSIRPHSIRPLLDSLRSDSANCSRSRSRARCTWQRAVFSVQLENVGDFSVRKVIVEAQSDGGTLLSRQAGQQGQRRGSIA